MLTPAQTIIRLGFGFAISQALCVVADLKIADRLAAGERCVDDLAAETGSDPNSLYRIMRLLAAEGLFWETEGRLFRLTEVGAALGSDGAYNLCDLVRMLNREPYLAFAKLGHSVRTGLPAFNEVFGKSRFDWLADHPDEAALFQRAMIALGHDSNQAIVEAYDFAPFSRVVDVGGGHGQLLSAVLARHPHISGVLFDLPSALDTGQSGARNHFARTEIVPGNFFESVPAGGDIYLLKKVIHDWNDKRAGVILRNCRDAMVPHAKLLLAEAIIPPGNEPNLVKLTDVNMLVVTGGVERSRDEYANLLAAAGLRLERVISTVQPISVLEASRA